MTTSSQALSETHAAAFQDRRPWSAEEFSQLLQSPGVILCGDAWSFVLGRVIAGEAEVLTIATHPNFQRQGRAQSSLKDFVTQAIGMGAEASFLEVSDDNTPAKALYLKQGFEVTGRRVNYYASASGQKVDALIMQKTLK